MAPKVSVNICCYNGDKYLQPTIDSIFKQTYADFEIVIIDDGSKDKTQQIVRSYHDDRIKYHYQENHGLSYSRNKARSCSRGEYIAIVDQDDIWYPEKLERQVKILDHEPDLGLVYSDANYIDSSGRINGSFFHDLAPQRGNVTKGLLSGNFIPCPTVLLRLGLLKQTGPFREDLRFAEEYELFLRLSLISRFEFINRPLAGYRVHENNTSNNMKAMYGETISILTEFSQQPIEQDLVAAAKKQVRRLKLATAAYHIGKIIRRIKGGLLCKR